MSERSFDVVRLRDLVPAIVCVGGHRGVIQSMLDFDYLSGRPQPSVIGIVAAGRAVERFYFGEREVVLPVAGHAADLPAGVRQRANLLLNLASGRRVLDNCREAFDALPTLTGGSVFAEGVPERHAIELQRLAATKNIWMTGPASVGLVLPGMAKLGAIGGVEAAHLQASRLFAQGAVAVVSSSGGMVNELIRSVALSGHGVSFAVALGGERWPMLTPAEVFLAAEADAATQAIVYFGELGGEDEYALAELIKTKRITKPVLAYIAGTVADLFDNPPQFGHAKAMAGSKNESATAKREALAAAGAQAFAGYGDFIAAFGGLPGQLDAAAVERAMPPRRPPALFVNAVSGDDQGDVKLLGQELLSFADNNSFGAIVISMLLGRQVTSKPLEEFTDFCLRLLVDHGPYVSGVVNTMVTARAGRDMVSSLAAGLLTVGPRFGGAINQAAATWLDGVAREVPAVRLVEDFAASKRYLSGIGHRKYRTDRPDPRVGRLLSFAEGLAAHPYTDYAQAVAHETSAKKANLILNVDGAIAAVMLDLLEQTEHFSKDELDRLVEVELFNALFVLSRSVGFMAHYYDQRRHDEGLFRLGPDDVLSI